MNSAPSSPLLSQKPLRVWPALVLAVIIVLCRYVPPFIEGASSQYWFVPIFFPMIGSALILIWWLAASRASAREKLLGLLGLVVAVAVIVALSHPSMRGLLTTYLTLPLGMVGFAIAAYVNRDKAPPLRLRGILLGTVVALGVSLLLRSEGVTGDYVFALKPRWTPEAGAGPWSDEKATTAQSTTASTAAAIETAVATAEWPGFRGADRMGHAAAPKLATDWKANPPKLLWKKPVGAGWASFAVAGLFAFTQEQRGPHETAVCYDVTTGNEVWVQQWEARFEESMGGPGPRATPTLADGAVFVFGGTGMLVRLKAGTGELVWKQDVKALSGRELPMWGFASSPLVTGSLVIVYAGGAGDKGVMAFDAKSGEPRWSAACGPESYSSPQLSQVLGEETLLMLTNDGLLLLDPASGKVRLNYEWKFQGYRALQPTVTGEDTILLPTPMSEGTRAIRISKKDDHLAAEELWTTKHMKPDFTELTVHKGYLYGIDGSMFSCIDLKTGQRTWKEGRYGKGQALLLEASDALLIAAEDGRIVLIKADPTAHTELASFQAIKGKTWNHPVVVGNRLLVRNAQEAACYELPIAK